MKQILTMVGLVSCLLFTTTGRAPAQGCSKCQGGGGSSAQADNMGVIFSFSLGMAQYGQSAGTLYFSTSNPTTNLYNPSLLQYSSPTRTDVTVITNSAGIRQVNAPHVLADVIVVNTNDYQIRFYYPSQVGSLSGGVYSLTGSPYIVWDMTNTIPSTIYQLQVSEVDATAGLIKQFSYAYATNTGIWSMQSLSGLVQQNNNIIPLTTNTYQVSNTWQSAGGPIVQQVVKTYQTFSWGTAPIQIAVGSGSDTQITTYTYYETPPTGNHGSPAPIKSVIYPDGSWQYYSEYDGGTGLPSKVASSEGDIQIGDYDSSKQTYYVYGDVLPDLGDDPTLNPTVPRETRVYSGTSGMIYSDSFTAFPSVGVRLDIQSPGALWYDDGRLITTNLFYTNGPNQYLPKAIVRPDLTMSTYNYYTNSTGAYRTNVVASGQPDATFTYIVDGTTNYTVLNQYGFEVEALTADIKSGITLAHDTYGNFDVYDRPQQVTHLDGTTEYTEYACCGLESTTDRDGVSTVYLYDEAKRQIGYTKFYGANGITYTNLLDAAGRTLASFRVGTNGSQMILSRSAYDLAGELLSQTNALSGVTSYTRTTNSMTGGLIRTATYPDGGTSTNYYYADGRLKQTLGTAVRPATYVYDVDDTGSGHYYSTVYKLDGSGGSNEWTSTYQNQLLQSLKTVYASASSTVTAFSYYNGFGQLTNQVDPDGISTLYIYNAKGQRTHSALDTNLNGTIDFAGSDRITFTTNDVVSDYGVNVRRSRSYTWSTTADASNLVMTMERSVDGLKNWSTAWNNGSAITSSNQTAYGGSGYRYETNWTSDGSFTAATYQYGFLLSLIRNDATGTQIGSTTYAYDAHGRQYEITDARNGTTTYQFNALDQATNTTTPSPGGSLSAETTTLYTDTMGRTIKTALPDSTSMTNVYYPTGDLEQTSGSRTYPVKYTYDAQRRMKTMTTWKSFAANTGSAVTTWNYDVYRGWLTNKTYDGGTAGPVYTYTAAGRLASRAWARGITTSYSYDTEGQLATVSYSDSTPGVAYGYDRRGRQTQIVQGGTATTTLTYTDQGQTLAESYAGGPQDGLSVTNGYDTWLRRTNLVVKTASSVLTSNYFSYDNASRLATVSDGTNAAAYSYVANSPLVSEIDFKQSGTLRMSTTKSYDYLNRLTGISSANASSVVLDSHNYNYNPANQRTAATNADGTYWAYQYDSLGQVTSGIKHWSDGSVVAGQQFGYGFDDIGNRTTTSAGGDQWGANLRYATYSANNLNQYTSRTVPNGIDVIGSATNTATVTVNDQMTYRHSNYYRMQLPLTNHASPVWQAVTNVAVLNEVSDVKLAAQTNNTYLPQSPESFNYDADGNLTNDGRWQYIWDAENRLLSMTNISGVPAGARMKLDFAYDAKSRRISKSVTTNVTTITTNFVYDGWNLLANLGSSATVLRSYMWGTDLSGSMQGAGGVGGLLEVKQAGTATNFVSYDGNGNVTMLANASDSTVTAVYEYGPFGEVIHATGAMVKANPFRFSTKYQDDESDFLYYGYRFYCANLGRWLNRDPLYNLNIQHKMPKNRTRIGRLTVSLARLVQGKISRIAFQHIYDFLGNDGIASIDLLGLDGDTVYINPNEPASPVVDPPDTAHNEQVNWCIENPCCCASAHNSGEEIKGLMQRTYGEDGNMDDTRENAIKHCTWMCYVASKSLCGVAAARSLGLAHEGPDGTSDAQHLMDLHNNDVGLGIGGKSMNDCLSKCQQAALGGKNNPLTWLVNAPEDDRPGD